MRTGKPDAFERLLAEERRRNAQRLNALRAIGVTAFLALRVVLDWGRAAAPAHDFPWLLLGYWLVAVGLWAASRRSPRLAELSALAVPCLDMPAVCLSQWLDLPHTNAPRAVANFTLGVYVVLITLSALMLRRQVLRVGAGVAAALQLWLQSEAGETSFGMVSGVALLALGLALCEYALTRRLQMVRQLVEGQLRAERLARYFSPQVAEEILERGDALAAARQCDITVLFSDVRGFTELSERLAPAAVQALLNEVHERMVEVVFAHGGTLDKYMGDGLMAYFGAPVLQPDHAAQAVRCALAMQRALGDLNAARGSRGERALRLSIGLHTGPAVLGIIGARSRPEFTAVGYTVNLAARVEQLTRIYEPDILLSEDTARRLGPEFRLRQVDETSVKGRREPLRVFTPDAAPDLPG